MTDSIAVEIVNIIGSGDLGVEIDLSALSEDVEQAEYNSEKYHGLYVRFSEDKPLTTVYRSGKYIITGADSKNELFETQDRVLSLFERILSFEKQEVVEDFKIQNVVCGADLGTDINLNALSIGLGLEHVEYEPEQFPGLVFRPSDHDCVILIFASGKVVITGARSVKEAEKSFNTLQEDTIKIFK